MTKELASDKELHSDANSLHPEANDKGSLKEEREKEKKAVIISGFPGIGKSSLFRRADTLKVLDSDSTSFSWTDETKQKRHPDWPQNYLAHIKDKQNTSDVILVS